MGNMYHRVVVIGGGVAGMTAAYRLAQAAARDAKLSIDLIESSDRLGGQIGTERVDGFLLERGPDSFLTRKPQAAALCAELGLGDHLTPTNQQVRRSFVRRAGQLHQLPEGMSGLVPTRLLPLLLSSVLPMKAKARVLGELFVRRGDGDAEESVASFVRRRFGSDAYDFLMEPLLCGIHAGDGNELSLPATAPTLRDVEQEHGSVLRGLRIANHAMRSERPKFPTAFASLDSGLGKMVETLAERLRDVRVRTGVCVNRVSADTGTYTFELSDGESITAAASVLATPAFSTASMLRGTSRELSAVLDEIPFVSSASVWLGFRSEDVSRSLNGYGYVVPRREGGRVIACSWTSTKLSNRAPAGHVLVRVFLGRAGMEIDDATSDDELQNDALDEARTVLGASRPPLVIRTYRYPKAMPQYTLGHLGRLDRIDRLLEKTPGLFLAGNSYHGIGVSDCIASGQQAAAKTLRYLEDIVD